jgi:hypothetical protein
MPDSSPVSVKQNQNRACGQCNRCVPPKLRISGALTSSCLTVVGRKQDVRFSPVSSCKAMKESPLQLDEETYNIQATARNQNARFAIEPVRPVSIRHAESVPLRRGPSTCRERAF